MGDEGHREADLFSNTHTNQLPPSVFADDCASSAAAVCASACFQLRVNRHSPLFFNTSACVILSSRRINRQLSSQRVEAPAKREHCSSNSCLALNCLVDLVSENSEKRENCVFLVKSAAQTSKIFSSH